MEYLNDTPLKYSFPVLKYIQYIPCPTSICNHFMFTKTVLWSFRADKNLNDPVQALSFHTYLCHPNRHAFAFVFLKYIKLKAKCVVNNLDQYNVKMNLNPKLSLDSYTSKRHIHIHYSNKTFYFVLQFSKGWKIRNNSHYLVLTIVHFCF